MPDAGGGGAKTGVGVGAGSAREGAGAPKGDRLGNGPAGWPQLVQVPKRRWHVIPPATPPSLKPVINDDRHSPNQGKVAARTVEITKTQTA